MPRPPEDFPLIPSGGGGQLPAVPPELVDAARAFVREARAPSTRRGYAGDLRRFEAWCGVHGLAARPALPETLALYIAWLATTGRLDRRGKPTGGPAKRSTILRAVSAISQAHDLADLQSPRTSRLVREELRGVARKLGSAPTKKKEILRDDLIKMIDGTSPDTLRGIRDRALLCLGWGAALRRSELVALDREDLRLEPEGIAIVIRRSKTDQAGAGETLGIVGTLTTAAVTRWLEVSECTAGAVFRRVELVPKEGAPPISGRLTSGEVARIVRRALRRAGFEPTVYAGHSLRSGFITQAARDGKPLDQIMAHSRHRSVKIALGYIQRGNLFNDSATKGVAL